MKFELSSTAVGLRNKIIQLQGVLPELDRAHTQAIQAAQQASAPFPFERASEISHEVETAFQEGKPCPVPTNSEERPVYEAEWALSVAFDAKFRCKFDLSEARQELSMLLMDLVVP